MSLATTVTTTDLKYVKTELFDADVMHAILRDTSFSKKDLGNLSRYNRSRKHANQVEVVYHYGKGCEENQLGRLYVLGGQGLQAFPFDIRNPLLEKHYWDLDMENCHYVILAALADKWGLKTNSIRQYINNRDVELRRVSEHRGIAKTAFLKIAYGGNIKMYNEHYNDDGIPVEADLTLVRAIEQEMEAIVDMCWVKFEQYQKLAIKKAKEKKPVGNPKFTLFALILQTEERKCLLALDAFLKSKGRQMDIFIHDGGEVRKLDGEKEFPKELITGGQLAIKDATCYSHTLKIKPFVHHFQIEKDKKNIIPPEILVNDKFAAEKFVELCGDSIRKVNSDIYVRNSEGRWGKTKYDVKAKVLEFSDKLIFYQLNGLGALVPRDYGGCNKNINALIENIPFFAQEGPLPVQFAYEFTEESSENGVELFKELINLATDGNEDTRNYLINYLAHILQQPFDLPGVCIIMTGEKGTGKDTLFDFFMEYVVGNLYTTNYNRTAQIFEKHDTGRLNKFMVKLEEADRKECLENSSELKSFITGRIQTFNPKGVDPFGATNYCRIIFTTNKGNPVDFSEGERRFVILNQSAEKKNDFDFWTKIRSELFTIESGKAVAEWLNSIDLSSFNVRTLPKNDYNDFIVETEESIESKFVKQLSFSGGLLTTELFELYKTFCFENCYNGANNVKSLGIRLVPFVRDKKLLWKRSAKGAVYSLP